MDCKLKKYIHKELSQHRISQGSMASPGFDSHGISKTRSWVAHGRKNKNSQCTESFQVAWPLYVVCSGASHDTSTKNSPRNRNNVPVSLARALCAHFPNIAHASRAHMALFHWTHRLTTDSLWEQLLCELEHICRFLQNDDAKHKPYTWKAATPKKYSP